MFYDNIGELVRCKCIDISVLVCIFKRALQTNPYAVFHSTAIADNSFTSLSMLIEIPLGISFVNNKISFFFLATHL